jgi:hypothetical protein
MRASSADHDAVGRWRTLSETELRMAPKWIDPACTGSRLRRTNTT